MLPVALKRRKRKVVLDVTRKEFEQLLLDFNIYAEKVFTMTTVVQSDVAYPAGMNRRDSLGRFAGQPTPPSFKQLFHFAEDFAYTCNGLPIPGERPIFQSINTLPGVEEYAAIIRAVERYNLMLTRSDSSRAVRRAGEAAYTQLTRLHANTNRAARTSEQYGNNEQILKQANAPRRRGAVKSVDILSELLAICKAFPCVWNTESRGISVITPPAVIISPTVRSLKYEFGQFFIQLRRDRREQLPLLKAHTPRYPRQGTSHPHPHVQESGTMCYGDGGAAATRAWHSGRIFDVVEIICSVLNNYGSNPYVTLEQWNGVCDKRFDPDTGQQVAIDAILRPSQVLHCEGCGSDVEMLVGCENQECQYRQVCIGCLVHCQEPGCHNYVCEDHLFRCRECNCRICSQHFHANSRICDHCSGWSPLTSEGVVDPESEPEWDDDEDDEDDS